MYVDEKGEVCSQSTPFTFSAPKPLEDLVTLEQGEPGGEEGEDMLLVIPRAELLQVRTSTLSNPLDKEALPLTVLFSNETGFKFNVVP